MKSDHSHYPIVPEDMSGAGVKALVRTVVKIARGAFETRGAVTPSTLATLTGHTRSVVADFLDALTAQSAGAALLAQGLQLSFENTPSISLPKLGPPSASNVGWVQELQPIPVRQLNAVGGQIITPRKLAVMTVLSREMLEGSNAEALVRDTLTQSATMSLDEALLDSSPEDPARPAGLRNGVSALVAGTSMADDVAALAASVSVVSGNQPIVLVADPAHAIKLKLAAPAPLPFSVLASSAVSMDGVVIAVAAQALVNASGTVRIEASRDAVLHMDSTPSPISSSPSAVAAPSMSLFQTDCASLRLLMECAWTLRDPRGIAWTEPTSW